MQEQNLTVCKTMETIMIFCAEQYVEITPHYMYYCFSSLMT